MFDAPDAVDVVGVADYDERFADLALPSALRERGSAHALMAALLEEGPRARVEVLLGFLRRQGVEADFSRAGLEALDQWLWRAPIQVQWPDRSDAESAVLLSPWRAIAVDVMVFVGELIRAEVPHAAWSLDAAGARVYGRLLPILSVPLPGGQAMDYAVSTNLYVRIAAAYGLYRSGYKPMRVEGPNVVRRLDEFLTALARCTREADEEQANRSGLPAIGSLPAASRREYERAAAAGEVGEAGEFLVFAPMPTQRAQAMIDDDDFAEHERPNPALVRFVSELYEKWPHITDPEDVPSPWEQDIYAGVYGDCVEVATNRFTPGAALTAAFDIARKHRMPIYSTEDGRFL